MSRAPADPGPGRGASARPITAHHLFPPLVALWFGALFCLSSLAVRTALFEQAVVAIGIDRLVPAASPPLGHTARLLIAALFGLFGAGLGHVVARLLAGPHPAGADQPRAGDAFYPASEADNGFRVRARDAHPDAPARRPISAHAELGDEPLHASHPGAVAGSWAEWASGRTTAEPDEPPAPPLPEWFTASPEAAPPNAAPDLAPVVTVTAREIEPASPPQAAPATETVTQPHAAPAADQTPGAGDDAVADPAFPDAWRNTAERIARAHPSALSHVELIERLAIALHERPDGPAAEPHAEAAAPPVAEPTPAALPGPGHDAAATIQALREALSTLRGG